MIKKKMATPVKDMRIWISRILRFGVLTSASLIVIGGVLFLLQHPGQVFSFEKFSSEPQQLRHIDAIFRQALHLRSRSVIQLGILILLSTPLLRVIFSFFEFLFNKDWIYVIITSIVMSTLCYSLLAI